MFHLVLMFIFVPQVTHFTGTVDVLTAKRLYPGAQGRRRAPLRSSGRRRTLGERGVHHASVEPKIMSHTRVFRDRNGRRTA